MEFFPWRPFKIRYRQPPVWNNSDPTVPGGRGLNSMTPEGPFKPYDFVIPVLTVLYREGLILQRCSHLFHVLFVDAIFRLERETPSCKEWLQSSPWREAEMLVLQVSRGNISQMQWIIISSLPSHPPRCHCAWREFPVARKGEGRLRRKENPGPKKLGEWAWQEGGGVTGRGIYGKSRTQSRRLRLKIKSLASPSRACVYMRVGVFKVP